MFTPIVFTTESAANQLGRQITAGKAGKAWEQVLQNEQNSSTGRGDSARHLISINIKTTQQDHFILISLPDKTWSLRRKTTEGGTWTSACAGESRAGQCSVPFVKVPHRRSFSIKCICMNDMFSHSCRRSWTQTSTCLHQLQQRRKRHKHQRLPKYFLFLIQSLYFTKPVCFYVKLILALLYLRNPLSRVRWFYQVGWSTRKCLLLQER